MFALWLISFGVMSLIAWNLRTKYSRVVEIGSHWHVVGSDTLYIQVKKEDWPWKDVPSLNR